MKRTDSGLWIAPAFLRFRRRERTVTLPNGERAKVWVDESGIVEHTEHGDHVDAVVRPKTVQMELRPRLVAPFGGGNARVRSLRAGIRIRK